MQVRLRPRQRQPGGHAELGVHEVHARDGLGHGVLDLQSRVHLQEVEAGVIALTLDQELDRACVAVTDRPRGRDRRVAHARAERRRQGGRRAFLDDLLVPALRRAVALEQVHGAAVRVGEHLDFDMARARDQPLDVEGIVAECGLRFVTRPGDRRREPVLGVDDPHAFSAPAGGGLDEQGKSGSLRGRFERGVGLIGGCLARHDRHTRTLHQPSRRDLRPHRGNGRRRRADEDQASSFARGRERRILGQKAVPGWMASAPVDRAASRIRSADR